MRSIPSRPVELLLSKLERVKERAGKFIALCPAHYDKNPSLSVAEGDDGRVLLNCFAGCSSKDVCASLGLTFSDLFPAPLHGDGRQQREWRPQSPPDGRSRTFSAESAARVWTAARARARDDDAVLQDGPVYRYVEDRGLAESWAEPGFGVLGPGMDLPAQVKRWPDQGYRVILPDDVSS